MIRRKEAEKALTENEGYVQDVVSVDLSDLIERDLEGVLDLLSEKVIGNELLMDIGYKAVGYDETNDVVLIMVIGQIDEGMVDIEDLPE